MKNIDINKLFSDKEKEILCFLAEKEGYYFAPWELHALFEVSTAMGCFHIRLTAWHHADIVKAPSSRGDKLINVQISKKGKEYVALIQEKFQSFNNGATVAQGGGA